MSGLSTLVDHCGVTFGIDDGWECACGEHLAIGSATLYTRQAMSDAAHREWVKHIEAVLT